MKASEVVLSRLEKRKAETFFWLSKIKLIRFRNIFPGKLYEEIEKIVTLYS